MSPSSHPYIHTFILILLDFRLDSIPCSTKSTRQIATRKTYVSLQFDSGSPLCVCLFMQTDAVSVAVCCLVAVCVFGSGVPLFVFLFCVVDCLVLVGSGLPL